MTTNHLRKVCSKVKKTIGNMEKYYLKPTVEEEEVRMGTTWLAAPSVTQPTKSRNTEEEDVDYGDTKSLWD